MIPDLPRCDGRRLATRGAVALVLLVVGGCSTQQAHRPVPTPAVLWQGGPPTGRLERDPWVEVVRSGTLAYATGWNAAVFTDDALTSTWSANLIAMVSDSRAGNLSGGSASVLLGPAPFAPISVNVAPDGGSAVVVVCQDASPEISVIDQGESLGDEPLAYALQKGEDEVIRIVGVGPPPDDFVLESGEDLTREFCADVPIAQGLFDPAPSLDEVTKLDGDDVIAPPKPAPSVTPIELRDRL